MENIFHRVSIRKYQDKPVEKEKIMQILKAGMQAPSACNQQPWEFYVVENREVLKQLGESSPFSAPAGKAPVLYISIRSKQAQVLFPLQSRSLQLHQQKSV